MHIVTVAFLSCMKHSIDELAPRRPPTTEHAAHSLLFIPVQRTVLAMSVEYDGKGVATCMCAFFKIGQQKYKNNCPAIDLFLLEPSQFMELPFITITFACQVWQHRYHTSVASKKTYCLRAQKHQLQSISVLQNTLSTNYF